MPISKGTAKVVAYKKEVTWGTLPGPTLGRQLRRVTSDFNLTKEAYESNELRTDRQVSDFRHGVRMAEGTLNGELSPRTYTDFIGSLLARDFTVGASATGLSVTIAGAGPTYTVTRAAGSWLTDGFEVGNVVRLTAGSFNVNNLNKNLLIASMTATVLTVFVLNGTTLTAEGPIASSTVAVTGRKTFVPATGHTDDSYSIEEFYSDIAQSEVYTGMKVGSMSIQLPATGLTTVDFSFMGRDLGSRGTAQYYTSPAAQGTEGIFAAVNGAVLVGGQRIALITSADLSVERALENASVVGSNSVAEIFTGRVRVSGNMSVYFEDAAFRNYFDNETTITVVLALTTDNAANANFVSVVLPKVKVNSFTKADSELGIIAQASFQALLNDVTGTGLPLTTISIQDSTT